MGSAPTDRHVAVSFHSSLEPAPTTDTHRSAQWAPVMDWVPPTLILRARKQGI